MAYTCRGIRNDSRKDIDEGKKYLKKTLTLPVDSSMDKADMADAKKLLENPSLACGYSRVQQEEVSDEAFKDEK